MRTTYISITLVLCALLLPLGSVRAAADLDAELRALVDRLASTNEYAQWKIECEIMSKGTNALPFLVGLLESCGEKRRPGIERVILLTLSVSDESRISEEILRKARAITDARFAQASTRVPQKSDIGGERESKPHGQFPWVHVYSYKTSRYPSRCLVDGAAMTLVETKDLPTRIPEWVMLAGIRLDTPDAARKLVKTYVELASGAYPATMNGEIEVTKVEERYEARCTYKQTVPSSCSKSGNAQLLQRACSATKVSRLKVTMDPTGGFAVLLESDPITHCDCRQDRR